MTRDLDQLIVTVGAPGDLGSIALGPAPRKPPGPGEIEIAVEAAALNFKDVLLALGLVGPGPTGGIVLGSECAGTVVAVGAGVTKLRIGDPVVALGRGCLARYVTVPARAAARKPEHLDMVEVVTLPAALSTADYALDDLGHLRKGERILIHAAAGGVGLAAVQLAHRLGAEIHATAGSEAKRAFLIRLGVRSVMDSRSLAFAEQLMDATSGRGVDVVLNSLSGAFLERSLSVLSPGGRMVELGVRDVMANTPLGMGLFRAGISLCVMSDRDELPGTGERLSRLLGAVARRELGPLPYQVFPARSAEAALRHLAAARHIGKVVLRWAGDAEGAATVVVPVDFTRACTSAPPGDEPAAGTSPATGILPVEGPEIFERALRCGWPQVVISTSPLGARLGGVAALQAAPASRAVHRRPALRNDYVRPRGPIEETLAAQWMDALGLDAVGVHDDFFELGGDSLLAVQVLARARRELGADLPSHSLVELPTIAGLAARLAPARDLAPATPETIVALRPGSGTPLFLLHPVGGQVYIYRDLVALLPREQPVHGIRARAVGADAAAWTIPELAAGYLRDLLAIQERGPFFLGGSSFGGVLAFEMARQLVEGGHEVALLAMLDAPGPGCLPAMFEDDASILGYLLAEGRPSAEDLERLRRLSRAALIEHFLERAGARPGPPPAESIEEVQALLLVWRANQRALFSYQPQPYSGQILFFTATESDGVNLTQPERAWHPLARGGVLVHPVPGTHITMNYHPNIGAVAAVLGPALATSLGRSPGLGTGE